LTKGKGFLNNNFERSGVEVKSPGNRGTRPHETRGAGSEVVRTGRR